MRCAGDDKEGSGKQAAKVVGALLKISRQLLTDRAGDAKHDARHQARVPQDRPADKDEGDRPREARPAAALDVGLPARRAAAGGALGCCCCCRVGAAAASTAAAARVVPASCRGRSPRRRVRLRLLISRRRRCCRRCCTFAPHDGVGKHLHLLGGSYTTPLTRTRTQRARSEAVAPQQRVRSSVGGK